MTGPLPGSQPAVSIQEEDGQGPLVEPVRAVPRRRAIAGFFREAAEIVLFAVLIFLVVRVVVQNFVVEGPSMQPTLKPGQLLIVNKQAYTRIPLDWIPGTPSGAAITFGTPQRGDIVVLHGPTASNRDLIKRVIGLPGETIEVRGGQVLVNGTPIVEPYVMTVANYSSSPTVIPPGQVYVLGDNRANSSDSHIFGAVPIGELVGKAIFTYWPPEAIGPAPNFRDYAPDRMLPAGMP